MWLKNFLLIMNLENLIFTLSSLLQFLPSLMFYILYIIRGLLLPLTNNCSIIRLFLIPSTTTKIGLERRNSTSLRPQRRYFYTRGVAYFLFSKKNTQMNCKCTAFCLSEVSPSRNSWKRIGSWCFPWYRDVHYNTCRKRSVASHQFFINRIFAIFSLCAQP